MSYLKVYTASAGAGKTYNLTLEYLRLILQKGKSIDSIQAVTFTNKATEEMQERIVQELYKLYRSSSTTAPSSPYIETLCSHLQLSPQALAQRAGVVLEQILLHYEAFRVKTIDSFFQEVLRHFAYELGLSGAIRPSTDADEALEAAVVGVMTAGDEVDTDQTQLDWFKELASQQILEGKGHNLKRVIKGLAHELLKEEVKNMMLSKELPNREQLKQFAKELESLRNDILDTALEHWRRVQEILLTSGLELEMNSYGKTSGYSRLYAEVPKNKRSARRFISGQFSPSGRLISNAENIENAIGKKPKPGAKEALTLAQGRGLQEATRSLVDYLCAHAGLLVSYNAAGSLLSSYAFISQIAEVLLRQQREKGSMLLADVPSLINQILQDESGVHFIYERLGTRLEHHMIDEFQDTSYMQYRNFRPLLEEALDQGGDCLVVGDVKQSIYRWRNSDSSLLAEQVHRDFEGRSRAINLKENWRSTPEIIRFNNALFTTIAERLSDEFQELFLQSASCNQAPEVQAELERLSQTFTSYYSEVVQEIPSSHAQDLGQVGLHAYAMGRIDSLLSSDEADLDADIGATSLDEEGSHTGNAYEDWLYHTPAEYRLEYRLPELILDLQRRGYKPSDIAILVRTRREATAIGNILKQAEARLSAQGAHTLSLSFTSEEALVLSGSLVVRLLIASLDYIRKPQDPHKRLVLAELYRQLAQAKGLAEAVAEDTLTQLIRLGQCSLYECLEGIISLYHALISSGDMAYVIALQDEALRMHRDTHLGSIKDFLNHWHNQKDKLCVVSPQDESKLQLMTIHKSKGLGFPVVLLPFLNWSLTPHRDTILWCTNPIPSSLHIPRIPILYSNKLIESLFVREIATEMNKTILDALNILYVATTRAEEELHLFCPDPSLSYSAELNKHQSKEKKANTVLPLVMDFLATLSDGVHPEVSVKHYPINSVDARDDQKLPQYGALESPNDSLRIELKQVHSYSTQGRIACLRIGLEHFSRDAQRRHGKLMHHILSMIERSSDVGRAVESAVRAGLISREEAVGYPEQIQQWIESLPNKHWFDGSGMIITEMPIIGGGIEHSRIPDRIILYPDGRVHIIDYKFGKPRRSHRTQILEYQELIARMGYSQIESYLWYVELGRIEQVR